MTKTRYQFLITNQKGVTNREIRIQGGSGKEYQFLYDRRRCWHRLRANPRLHGEEQFYVPEHDFNALALDIFTSPQIGDGGDFKRPFQIVPRLETVEVEGEQSEPVRVETNVNVTVAGQTAPETAAEKLTIHDLRAMAKEHLGYSHKDVMKKTKDELNAELLAFRDEQNARQASAIQRN